MRITTALVLGAVLIACGSSSERAAFDDGTAPAGSNGGLGGTTDPSLPTGEPKSNPESAGAFVPPTELGCSSRAQDILVLDFRSGWWSGGGGGGYSGVVLPAVVNACPKTQVDYHHFETTMHVRCIYREGSGGSCNTIGAAVSVADIRASFVHPNVGDYTQIWVLSGSDQDQSDIPTGDQLFKDILGDTRGTCIPLLIGAGDGFMTHAKSIANELGMGSDVFRQETNPPSFFSVAMGAAQSQSTIASSAMKPHLIFKGSSSLADKVGSFFGQAHGDSLAETVPPPTIYDVIAHDSTGKASIAIGAAKVSGDGYRPFIFDAGWQRMYVLSDPGTAQYLKNIVMYMGLVGCKAAPIGPVR